MPSTIQAKTKTSRPLPSTSQRSATQERRSLSSDSEDSNRSTHENNTPPTPNPTMYPAAEPDTTPTAAFSLFSLFSLCGCSRRGSRTGPLMCCGQRFSRRLRQPNVVRSLMVVSVMLGIAIGVSVGCLLSLTLIRYLKINPAHYTTTHAKLTDWTADMLGEAFGLLQGAAQQCYSGPHGNKPFAEHDGFFEDISRVSVVYEVIEWYPKPTSAFQDIEMFKSSFFGNVLVIDNEIMITEKDEAHYHEMIAHVPLAYNDQAQRVLIIGGGDGGTLGQVLKHHNVKEVTIIELDPAVVATSRTYFPQLAQSFDDPRVTLMHANGAQYVAEYVGLVYDNDLILDAAVESILGDGDERIRATRRPTIEQTAATSQSTRKRSSGSSSGSISGSSSGGSGGSGSGRGGGCGKEQTSREYFARW